MPDAVGEIFEHGRFLPSHSTMPGLNFPELLANRQSFFHEEVSKGAEHRKMLHNGRPGTRERC
jgi:hypothetical protein